MPKRTSSSVGSGFSLSSSIGTGDHARRAESTLQTVMFLKHLLQHMQAVRLAQTFDCGDVGAAGLRCKHRAGFDRLAIHVNGARAAMGSFAANVWPGDVQTFAQNVNEQFPRFSQCFHVFAVDLHFEDAFFP